MDWNPDPDEELLIRTPAVFATGAARPVAGYRWFRDTDRADIQSELPGWPPGPVYVPHPNRDKNLKRAGYAMATTVQVLANIAAGILGASGSAFGNLPDDVEPDEPENEVEDFPVMWAAPGSVARTVPWQLDPDRRPEGMGTDIALTTRRVLVLATGPGPEEVPRVLWEEPRDTIAGARLMAYSTVQADVRITFGDGSWIRLFTGSSYSAERLTALAEGASDWRSERGLTDGQRERVDDFRDGLPEGSAQPWYQVLPSGIVMMQVQVPAKRSPGQFDTSMIFMDDYGRNAKTKPGDL